MLDGPRPVILAPLLIEARALRRGLKRATAGGPPTPVIRTGMGPKRAARAGLRPGALTLPDSRSGPPIVVVSGFCGGLKPEIRTGDVIVASELRGPDGVVSLPVMPAFVEALRAAGLTVHVGPITGSERVAIGDRRTRAAADGSLGVDMESYWLLERYSGRAAVVRAVSDTAGPGLLGGMLPGGWLRAYRSLVLVGEVVGRRAGWVQ